MATWMIYGANGYTGRIAAEEARRKGHAPILAGRSREKLEPLAKALDLPVRAFDLADPAAVVDNLRDVDLVLHCAGPFSATSRPMLDGCVQTKTHYLDITGEIAVFEGLHRRHAELQGAGVVGISGVGFDVVPSDCLAAMLHRELPDAKWLRMGMRGLGGSISPGTAKTMVEGLSQGGCIRKDGKLTRVPTGWRTRTIPFTDKGSHAVTIPWGDVSTAYHSTGIPNIEFYLATPPAAVRGMRMSNLFSTLLGTPPVQRFLKRQIEKRVPGPTEEQRRTGRTIVWGEVENERSEKAEMRLTVKEGYSFTVDASLACVEKVLAGGVSAGAHTPSKAFGADFVLSLPDVKLERLAGKQIA